MTRNHRSRVLCVLLLELGLAGCRGQLILTSPGEESETKKTQRAVVVVYLKRFFNYSMVLVGSMVVVSVFFTMSTINMVQTSIPMFLPRLEERKLTDLQQNLSHEDLKKLSKTELVRLWHSLPAPKLSTVSGFYDGRIACVGPLHPVSRFLTRSIRTGSWAESSCIETDG